jgi:hypothetical protein
MIVAEQAEEKQTDPEGGRGSHAPRTYQTPIESTRENRG